jgi:hypothetical protein
MSAVGQKRVPPQPTLLTGYRHNPYGAVVCVPPPTAPAPPFVGCIEHAVTSDTAAPVTPSTTLLLRHPFLSSAPVCDRTAFADGLMVFVSQSGHRRVMFSVACAKREGRKPNDGTLQDRLAASWGLDVAPVKDGKAIDVAIKAPGVSMTSNRATISRDKDGPTMWHDVVGDAEQIDDVLRALAAVGASYGVTTGGEVWFVSSPLKPEGERHKIPFCIARDFLDVVDCETGTTVACFTSRGRGTTYTTTLKKRARLVEDEYLPVPHRGDVSHPQLPLLRVLLGTLTTGTLQLVGVRVKWLPGPNGGAAAPLEVGVNCSGAAVRVSLPMIMLGVNPVR